MCLDGSALLHNVEIEPGKSQETIFSGHAAGQENAILERERWKALLQHSIIHLGKILASGVSKELVFYKIIRLQSP